MEVLRIHQPFLLASPMSNGASDFGFAHIFGEESTQEEVFDYALKPVLEGFLAGINSCICCYGQTGTGKTWTMSGGETYVSRGLIQRAIEALFWSSRAAGSSNNLMISYMEIYNEIAYDLLGVSEVSSDMDSFPRVTLRDDESGTLHMRNLSVHAVSTVEEAVDLFMFGNVNRIVSSTVMNDASSRSHCIFTIHMESAATGSCKLHLVDLAGSERVWKSRLTQTDLAEAKHINKSLHFLEQVMQSLYKKRSHIPYRNSILTSVLRDALGGACRTVLVGNVSTDACHYKETIATCRFLQRCSLIEVKAGVEMSKNNHQIISKKEQDEAALSLKPTTWNKFVFEDPERPLSEKGKLVTLRDLQEACGSNLSLFPKEYRKVLIEKIRNEGMDFKVNCVGDLCALIQVLVAKLTQSDHEKKELKERLKCMVREGGGSPNTVTINLSAENLNNNNQQWKQSNPPQLDCN